MRGLGTHADDCHAMVTLALAHAPQGLVLLFSRPIKNSHRPDFTSGVKTHLHNNRLLCSQTPMLAPDWLPGISTLITTTVFY